MKKLLAVFVLMVGFSVQSVFSQEPQNLAELELLNEFLGNEPINHFAESVNTDSNLRSPELLHAEKAAAEHFYKALLNLEVYGNSGFEISWIQIGRAITERNKIESSLGKLIAVIETHFINKDSTVLGVETQTSHKLSVGLAKTALAAFLLPEEHFSTLKVEVKSALQGIKEISNPAEMKVKFGVLLNSVTKLRDVYANNPIINQPKTFAKIGPLHDGVKVALLDSIQYLATNEFSLSNSDVVVLLQDFGEGKHGFLNLARNLECMLGYQAEVSMSGRGYKSIVEPLWRTIRMQLNNLGASAEIGSRVKFRPFVVEGPKGMSGRYQEMIRAELPGKDPAETVRARLVRAIGVARK